MTTQKEFPINCQGCASPVRDCICEVYEYSGTFTFKTDQELTDEQIEQIIFALFVQIEEPTDSSGEDEEFKTSEITIKLEAN
jgi:hypothetical protein